MSGAPLGIIVCRGCCCGNPGRDPETDHRGQLNRLRRMAAGAPHAVQVRTSDCLGPCGQANIIVVRPSLAGRRRGGRPVWLAFVRDHGILDVLGEWIAEGGPGLAALPDELDLHVVDRPATRRRRR